MATGDDKPSAERVLKEAGWFPGRSVDCEKEMALLRLCGFEPHDAVEPWFREYAGLTVSAGEDTEIRIGDEYGFRQYVPIQIHELERQAGVALVSVATDGATTWYLDPLGGIWGAIQWTYGKLGENLRDALQAVLDGRQSLKLMDEFWDPTREEDRAAYRQSLKFQAAWNAAQEQS